MLLTCYSVCGMREDMGGQNVTTTAASGSETGTGVEPDMAKALEAAEAERVRAAYDDGFDAGMDAEARERDADSVGSLGVLTVVQLWELASALDMDVVELSRRIFEYRAVAA